MNNCDICGGTGWKKQNNNTCIKCDCRIAQEIELRKINANIHYRFQSCTIENYMPKNKIQEKALQRIYGFLNIIQDANKRDKFDRKSIYMYGPVGVGKTHLISAMGLILAEKYNVFYLDWIDFQRILGSGESIESRNFAEINKTMIKIKKSDIFIFDEFYSYDPSPWVREKVHEIVNHAYNDKKTIIVSSNLSPNTLETKVDSRTFSRIDSMTVKIKLDGTDYRRMK